MYENLIRIIYLQSSKVRNIRTYDSDAVIFLTNGYVNPYFVEGKVIADVLEDVSEPT